MIWGGKNHPYFWFNTHNYDLFGMLYLGIPEDTHPFQRMARPWVGRSNGTEAPEKIAFLGTPKRKVSPSKHQFFSGCSWLFLLGTVHFTQSLQNMSQMNFRYPGGLVLHTSPVWVVVLHFTCWWFYNPPPSQKTRVESSHIYHGWSTYPPPNVTPPEIGA